MERRVSTIIIEPRPVLREALELLMGNHSYRVVCGVGSIEQIPSLNVMPEGPELVILGAQSADSAAQGAKGIRELSPSCKIIFLFDSASPTDFQNLLASEIDGCIPLFVSPDTLISTLDLIVSTSVRVMVMGEMKSDPKCQPGREETPQAGMAGRPAFKGGQNLMDVTMTAVPAAMRLGEGIGAPDILLSNGNARPVAQAPRLSEREAQIMDGLVKGFANKVIARRCDITEATVKVHMKSILRKIRAGNRTQAAIWALEHGFCSDEANASECTDGVAGHQPLNGFRMPSGEKGA